MLGDTYRVSSSREELPTRQGITFSGVVSSAIIAPTGLSRLSLGWPRPRALALCGLAVHTYERLQAGQPTAVAHTSTRDVSRLSECSLVANNIRCYSCAEVRYVFL